MKPPTEQEIVAWLCQGQERGAQALWQRWGPLLRYVIAPLLPQAQDQEDCLAEILLRIWQKIGSYDPTRGSLQAWLTALARHAALDQARKNARHQEQTPLDDSWPTPCPTPEEALLDKERQQALLAALAQLSSIEQQLFYRKYYYQQPLAQIAAECGLSLRAVEGRLYRLKKHLRQLLGGEDHAPAKDKQPSRDGEF